MRRLFILGIVLLVCLRQRGWAEELEPLENQDSVGSSTPAAVDADAASAAVSMQPTAPAGLSGKDEFWQGWKQLPKDLVRDQKEIWTFPIALARGKHLKPTIAVVGVTAALIALDGHPAAYFSKPNPWGTFNKVFSGPRTAQANYIIPLTLYGISLVRRDTYGQKTFLLAGEAVINAEILTSVMKDIDRRANPNDMPVGGPYGDSWFKNKFAQNLIGGNGSFPSGHTIAAFSVATVYAERYKNLKWVKWVAYGLAAVDGFSRISLQSHYASEVFLGATLGYVLGRQAVKGAR
jgi:membrane-associated phospholipid phosphatase